MNRVNPANRPRDSKSCEPCASPPGCLPAVTAENPTVPKTRVERTSWNPNWVTVVPNTDSEVSTDSSSGSVNTIPDTPQVTASVQVRPVAKEADQSLVTSTETGSDAFFERGAIKAAQIADDSLRVVIAYCNADKNEVRTLPEEARDLLLQWDSLHLKDNMLCRKYHYPDGTSKYLQLILPGKLRRLYVE